MYDFFADLTAKIEQQQLTQGRWPNSILLNFLCDLRFDIEKRKRKKNDVYPTVSPNGNDDQCQRSSDFMSGQQ